MPDAVRITSRSGRVRVIGEARADVAAEGASIVDRHGQREVRCGSKTIEVRVPVGTDLVVGTSSGDVELRGDLGHVGVTTVSWGVTAEQVSSIDARTKSGRVEVQTSSGAVRLKTGSSSIRIDQAAGEVRVASSNRTLVRKCATADAVATLFARSRRRRSRAPRGSGSSSRRSAPWCLRVRRLIQSLGRSTLR